jgi:hypothetical protein
VYDYWQKKGAANIAEVRRDKVPPASVYHVYVHQENVGLLFPNKLHNDHAAQVSRLQKNVEDLQHALLKSLHDRQQPTVIVAGSNGKSG